MFARSASFTLGVLYLAMPLLAQQGRIVGTITEATGAVIPHAKITAIHEATQVRREFLTDGTGNYDLPGLAVGTYSVRAEMQGFKSSEARVLVEVAQVVRQNLMLSVGEVRETVSVTADASQLQTDTAEMGQVITNRQIVELPLNGRSFTQLATLSTGVIPYTSDGLIQMNGARPGQEYYVIDGVSTNTPSDGRNQIFPSVESIQEFKLQSSTFAAEFGRAPGLVNVTTKAGTNEYHGNVYDFWRNDFIAANNYFENQKLVPTRPKLNRHQFGGTIGGPIRHNKTFFFGNWESQRSAQGTTTTLRTPTNLERAGDFSQVPGLNSVLDPSTFTPFANKLIPATRINGVYKYFSPWWPAPNDATGSLRIASPSVENNNNQYAGRVDHILTGNDTLYGRYFFSEGDSHNPGWGTQPDLIGGSLNENRRQQVVAHWNHRFSPRWLLDANYSYVRSKVITRASQTGFEGEKVTNHVTASGIGGMDFTSKFFPGSPVMLLSNAFGYDFNWAAPLRQTLRTHGLTANTTYITGRHSIKGGIDFLRQGVTGETPLGGRGIFAFIGLTTASVDSWADFVLGVPAQGQRAVPSTRTGQARDTYQFFIQDDFKITSRLTLNFGVRYDYNLAPTSLFGGGVVDPATGKVIFSDIHGDGKPDGTYSPALAVLAPILGSNLVSSSSLGLHPSFTRIDRTNFAPRVGMAWRPFDNRTVLRAGYGMYYLTDVTSFISVVAAQSPPFSLIQTVLNLAPPLNPIERIYTPFESTTAIAPSQWTPYSVRPNTTTPYENQFSFSVERQIADQLLVEAAYVGKTSIHLQQLQSVALPANRPTFTPPFTTMFAQDATSNYHSLQLRAEKRYSGGLSFLSSYTWSKAMDSGSINLNNPAELNARRGVSSFDIPHRFVNSLVYDLPFGYRRKWLNGKSPVVGAVLGGWQFSTINQFQSGRAFDVRWLGGDTNNVANPISSVPDRIGSGRLDNPTANNWIDAAAFVPHRKPANPAVPNTYLPQEGNTGRNILRADGIANWDIGIMKNFLFGPKERVRVQFRAEMFNAFNHVTFNRPGFAGFNGGGDFVILGGVNATKVIATDSNVPPRQIQFALKVYF